MEKPWVQEPTEVFSPGLDAIGGERVGRHVHGIGDGLLLVCGLVKPPGVAKGATG